MHITHAPTRSTRARTPRASWGALAISVAVVAVVAAVGASWTHTGPGTWYAGLTLPPWNPPSWLFAPVWTALYLAMAVAAWLVAGRGMHRRDVRLALGAYAVQLLLNFAWTGIFFALEAPGWALVDINALWLAIVVTTILFWRLVPVAGWLMVPYLLWVAYAASLNASIAALN
jgi:tryptophan-rich sensory protein